MATNAYQKAINKQRTAGTLQGAATGATAGASVGSAIYPGIGTAIGAAVGAVGGGIIGYATSDASDAQKAQMKELEELQKRQEMNALGLTDEERAAYEAQLIDPMRTTRREQQLQFQQALAGTDVGAGSVFKVAIGQEQRVAAQEQDARNEIERASAAERVREEQRINDLLGMAEMRDEQARAANMQSIQQLGSVADVYSQDMGVRAQNDAYAEQENAILEMYRDPNSTPEERAQAAETLDFMSQFYKGSN